MGKKKIDQLLAKLQENHRQDIHTSAAIFTVAQSAVNQLQDPLSQPPAEVPSLPALPVSPPVIDPFANPLTKADLEARYGDYSACRSAAKKAGITFRKNPSWSQLIEAFNYLQACQTCIDALMQQHPAPALKGTRLTLTL